MKILLILRGNYFSGQKEFITQNALEPYTLDLEELRFLAGGYKQLINSYKSLDFRNADEILHTLFSFLTLRMQRGEFCVVNAPNANNSLLKEYKTLCEKYRYKLFILPFENTSLEECKAKNHFRARQNGIFIPEHILEAIDTALQKEKIGKKHPLLEPKNWRSCLYESVNLSSYKKIHHIGDIQGCFSVLKKALKRIKKDEFYIFLGDYIDRGIENGKVIKWLLELKDLPNVILLEGNHERHLIKWANNEPTTSKEFNENTLKDFKKDKISKLDARALYKHFKDCFFYTYEEKKILCTHAGITYLPKNPQDLSFVPSEEFIYGIGGYEDSKLVAELFCQNTDENSYQLFGHRNRQRLPVQIAPRVFLCEGKVDAGEYLRVVSLSKKGFECKEIKNEVFRKKS